MSLVIDGLKDLGLGIAKVPLSYWLANKDISARYARTVLGPFWNVLSNALFVGALAFTFGTIFNMKLSEFLPYVAASMAIWNILSSALNDAPHLFPRNAGVISTYSLPLSMHVHKLAMDKIINLFHFLLVYLVICFVYPPPLTPVLLLSVLAVPVYYVFCFGVILLFASLGVRWRDIAPAISSLILLMFLITPIFWRKTPDLEFLVMGNPFYHLLEIGRGPLLGYTPEPINYIVSIGFSAALLLLGTLVFVRGRRMIFYWL